MTTDTEALRAQFERQCRGLDLSRNDVGDYTDRIVRVAWIAYQAGHAAAKAEIADVVAQERERCALVCEDVRRAVAEINGSGVAAAQQCADAIRAGAKERGE